MTMWDRVMGALWGAKPGMSETIKVEPKEDMSIVVFDKDGYERERWDIKGVSSVTVTVGEPKET